MYLIIILPSILSKFNSKTRNRESQRTHRQFTNISNDAINKINFIKDLLRPHKNRK